MGGTGWVPSFLKDLQSQDRYFFVISGSHTPPHRDGNLIFLNVHTYMPDVLASCDVAISKLGYSTLAEVYDAGCALAFIPRPGFPESPLLARFALAEVPAAPLDEDALANRAWLTALPPLLALPRRPVGRAQGAASAAAAIAELLG